MTLLQAERLSSTKRPRCEGIYHDLHHDPGGRCSRNAQYVVGGVFLCTKHAQPAALHIMLGETLREHTRTKLKLPKPKGPDYGKGYG